MTPDKRLQNILLATKLGPLTPFFGLVAGQCECGKPKGENHIRGRVRKLKAVTRMAAQRNNRPIHDTPMVQSASKWKFCRYQRRQHRGSRF
jgi:hypothetical protein